MVSETRTTNAAGLTGRVLSAVAATALLLAATPARAEERPSCVDLTERLARQAILAQGYGCRGEGAAWSAPAGDGAAAGAACPESRRSRLADLARERARQLETCLIRRLEAAGRRASEVSQWAARTPPGADVRSGGMGGAGMRPAGQGPGDAGEVQPTPLEPRTSAQGSEPADPPHGLDDDPAARAQSAQRVRELLARSPSPSPPADSPQPTSIAREFRAGLAWSYGGAIEGMHCTQWEEPSDPHDWFDNYLCASRDLGFRWSFRGPIQGRGLRCIQVKEPSDPHFWHDNYFCWPRDLRVTFRFSSAGRIPGLDCLAIVEPSDPHTWGDNFLCYREDSE